MRSGSVRVPPLKGEFEPREGAGNEFRSRDGRRLLDIQLRPQGVRDLHATFLKMAREVAKDKRVVRGILAAWLPRPTDDRIAREWRETLDLFKPSIAERMALVILRKDGCRPLPEDRDLRRIGENVRAVLGRIEFPAPETRQSVSAAFFEIFKVLFHDWILKKGPIAIGELMRRTGSSYPTVADALRRLEGAREIDRRSNRSVQLSGFPQKTWSEILALSASLRRTRIYADPSGRPPDPAALHRRLLSLRPRAVALGGVVAARHWDSRFDLNGLPRLDLSVPMASGVGDLGFLERLDPALKRVEPGARGIVLAVHPLFRAEPRFEKNPKNGMDWADPVETLLDLHELRLDGQAEEMIRRLSEAAAR